MEFVFRDVEQPINGLCEVYKNSWWTVDKETGHGAIYLSGGPTGRRYEHPQCNSNKQIADMLINKIDYGRPVEVRQIPVAYIRRYATEYAE
jgi:hypothetical protein